MEAKVSCIDLVDQKYRDRDYNYPQYDGRIAARLKAARRILSISNKRGDKCKS